MVVTATLLLDHGQSCVLLSQNYLISLSKCADPCEETVASRSAGKNVDTCPRTNLLDRPEESFIDGRVESYYRH